MKAKRLYGCYCISCLGEVPLQDPVFCQRQHSDIVLIYPEADIYNILWLLHGNRYQSCCFALSLADFHLRWHNGRTGPLVPLSSRVRYYVLHVLPMIARVFHKNMLVGKVAGIIILRWMKERISFLEHSFVLWCSESIKQVQRCYRLCPAFTTYVLGNVTISG